jgi:hypothetical protein
MSHVPSTPLREFASAVAYALTRPPDEPAAVTRAAVALALLACQRVIAAGPDPADVIFAVEQLRAGIDSL